MAKKFKFISTKYDLVLCQWEDAAGLRDGWKASHEKPSPYIALSSGWLIHDGPDQIVIAQDTDEEGSHNGRTQIPRGMVQHIKVLRKADKPKENGK